MNLTAALPAIFCVGGMAVCMWMMRSRHTSSSESATSTDASTRTPEHR